MTTAAGIIIGDEILSGKVQDTNALQLIQMLDEVGVMLMRLVTIRDDPEAIAEEIRYCSERFDYVFTSGGVGPTHDDLTMEGVARAFDQRVVRHPDLVRMIRRHWAERINEAALKLAEVPEGARLLGSGDRRLPVAVVANVYILPGLPQFFTTQLERVRAELRGTRRTVRSVYLSSDETSIAEVLRQVDREFAGVTIGSYPRLEDPEVRVRITVEGLDSAAVGEAVERLVELLPDEVVVRVE